MPRPDPVFFPSAIGLFVLRERRGVGLAFAGAHPVHLGRFLIFFAVGGTVPPLMVIVFGGISYLVIALMAATSNDWSVDWLGVKNWCRLHKFSIYYLWSIFALTYLANIAREPNAPIYVVLLMLVVLALLFRLAGGRLRVGGGTHSIAL